MNSKWENWVVEFRFSAAQSRAPHLIFVAVSILLLPLSLHHMTPLYLFPHVVTEKTQHLN